MTIISDKLNNNSWYRLKVFINCNVDVKVIIVASMHSHFHLPFLRDNVCILSLCDNSFKDSGG